MDEQLPKVKIPAEIALLPVRDVVVFPYMILPLFVGRTSSIKAVEYAQAHGKVIFLATQKNVADENPQPNEIYQTGTYAMIMRMRKLPDGRVKILVQGLGKAKVNRVVQKSPFYTVNINKLEDHLSETDQVQIEIEAAVRMVKEQLEKLVSLGKMLAPDILMILDEVSEPGKLADLIASNLGLKVEEAQEILETADVMKRLEQVSSLLTRELDVMNMQEKIRSQARDEMSRTQREYFLKEQLKAIKGELGEQNDKDSDVEELREKIEAANMPKEAHAEAMKQLGRLERIHPESTESSVVHTYLELLTEIPWSKYSKDSLDIKKAKAILDADHFGLEKVKDRILEFLAVQKLKHRMPGPILCFSGPPGVGKTSLGRSIARAMGREFIRISLGGLHDEAEIRGHRRTYVGSMPGKIIQGLKQAQTNNPVFMLDEVDKIGSDFRGDPASALLEVLDPEQNNSFRDHYLNLPFDLSNVFFIATANMIDPVLPALRDRMEVIQLPGYADNEKLAIAEKYLVPKQTKLNGLTDGQIKFSPDAIKTIIRKYTREAGLRNLEREIAAVCRKVARQFAEGKETAVSISDQNVSKYLGISKYARDEEKRRDEIGVATGLAWTPYGGEILSVEATEMNGKGGLILTGNLGQTMKESGAAGMSFIRAHANQLGIEDAHFFGKREIHVHVPQGGIPKDGPSAGVSIATALVSLLTHQAVRKDVAMTGEITLTGKVLPVGGIREKALAALREGIKTVIVPYGNREDLTELPKEVLSQMKFYLAKTLQDVLKTALIKRDQVGKEKPKKVPLEKAA